MFEKKEFILMKYINTIKDMYGGVITSVRIVQGDTIGVSHNRVFTLKNDTELILHYRNLA